MVQCTVYFASHLHSVCFTIGWLLLDVK